MNLSESFNVEFKREFTQEIKKEVVAFANTQGGAIYVGIDDKGQVVGVHDADKTLLQIVSSIRDSIRPDVAMHTVCIVEEMNGIPVIKVSVQRGTGRPYYIADKGLKPSGVYVRQGPASVPASEDAIRQMIKETDGDKFEAVRSLNQELTFDYAAAEFRKRELGFGEPQWKTLGIQGADGLFSNLGLLLSDQCVHTIKAACFEGTDKGVFKDRREFDGSLLKQLADAYAYIDLYNKTNATFSGLDRVDFPDYPKDAIREALLNAIVHREYSFSGSTLISIFDDRIEFVSLGGLVSGLTMDDIMLGVSQARNERLANIFYRLKYIEAYGTGIAKIQSSYRTLPTKPVIKATDSAFMVILPNRNIKSSTGSEEYEVNIQNNSQVKAILQYLADHGSANRRQLEQLLGVKQSRTANIIRNIVRDGLIVAVNRGKNTVYRLRANR